MTSDLKAICLSGGEGPHKAPRAKPYWYGELVGVGFAAVGAQRGLFR